MKYTRLGLKISFFVSVLIVLAVSVIAVILIISESKKFKEDILKDALVFANYGTHAIYEDYLQYYTHPTGDDYNKFKELIESKLSNNTDIVGMKLVGVNSVILFDLEEFKTGKYSGTERLVDDPELVDLIKSEGLNYREAVINDEQMIEVVRSVDPSSGIHVVSVYYLVSYDSVQERLFMLYKQFAVVFIPIIILAIIGASLLSLSITKPLSELAKATNKIKEGGVGTQVNIKSNDEIGVLSQAFNEMSVSIMKSQQQLEQRVKERTVELEAKNQELEDFNKVVVDRELKMIEMKKEIDRLTSKDQS